MAFCPFLPWPMHGLVGPCLARQAGTFFMGGWIAGMWLEKKEMQKNARALSVGGFLLLGAVVMSTPILERDETQFPSAFVRSSASWAGNAKKS